MEKKRLVALPRKDYDTIVRTVKVLKRRLDIYWWLSIISFLAAVAALVVSLGGQ